MIKTVPFLRDASPNFATAMINKLKFDVFLSGDIIVKEGTVGEEMFFLRKGTVEVTSDEVKLSHLTDGGYFGGKTYIELVVHNWCIGIFVHIVQKLLHNFERFSVSFCLLVSVSVSNFELSETVLENCCY